MVKVDAHSHGLAPGDYVVHQRFPEWGIGEVTALREEQVDIFFEEHSEFVFRLPAGRVMDDFILKLDESEVPKEAIIRDKSRWPGIRETLKLKRADARTGRNLGEMVARFRSVFVDGFEGEKFASLEREYKVAAAKEMTERLSGVEVERLIGAGDFGEIHSRAVGLLSPSRFNLVFRFEYFAFRDLPSTAHEAFARALLRMVQADSAPEMADSVEAMGDVLAPHGAARWTICTAFPFLLDPMRWPFVKPAAVATVAKVLDYETSYTARPNAKTFLRIHALYDLVTRALREADLAPRDHIDTQTFLWVGSGLGY